MSETVLSIPGGEANQVGGLEIADAVQAFSAGEMVLITDSYIEGETDVVMAAEDVTESSIDFLIENTGGGKICVPTSREILRVLGIKPMFRFARFRGRMSGTPFTTTVDHVEVGSGISSEDRAKTIREMANPFSTKNDFLRPGHVSPLYANRRGLLGREGHTDAVVFLTQLAGKRAVGVTCELLTSKHRAANPEEARKFADLHNMAVVHLDALVAHCRATKGDRNKLAA